MLIPVLHNSIRERSKRRVNFIDAKKNPGESFWIPACVGMKAVLFLRKGVKGLHDLGNMRQARSALHQNSD